MKKKIKLNLGCGVHLFGGFINVDSSFTLEELQKKKGIYGGSEIDKGAKFVKADMRKLPFKDNYADYILCAYAIEHLPMQDVVDALKEWYRVLKPKGKLVIATVNFDELAKLWMQYVAGRELKTMQEQETYKTLSQIIYGNQIGEGEFHCCPFTPFIMKEAFLRAGINKFNIEIHPTGALTPKLDGYPVPKGAICLSEEIIVRATK